ncbi:ABC transporter permease [Paenirhodobacter populi]|uniref:ABC transporter permease n=1 Tax=Paenirhodobacter populi TaxID=2306993 RepID=A0A443J8T2_9RHOB|nr:ABC transporter permease [Sinirhodobacter populi]RWR16942.1 ABC transporter permease [Sinirhodobacter populi]
MSGAAARPGNALPRWMRVSLLVAPGFVLVMLPFLGAMTTLGAYSLNINSTDGSAAGFHVWSRFLGDPFSWKVIWTSVRIAALATVFTLLLAYPTAAALLRLRNPLFTGLAYVALFSPLLMSVVSRSYGWMLLLSETGFVNALLGQLGLGPYRLIFNETGVIIAIVHVIMPYAVLPILNIMTQVPGLYNEAARDLGASGFTLFRRVTLPLTLPGIVVAAEIVFALSISAFVTPSLLGAGRVQTLSQMIYENIGLIEWAMAAVQAIVLLLTALAVLFVLERVNRSTHAAKGD